MKSFESGNVTKYVFSDKTYVAETVLYKYGDYMKRTVICCSTQSGCPVGCTFCGTGNKFIRNLTAEEIEMQIKRVLQDKGILGQMNNCEKFQIMFMSMGEPFLNYDNVEQAIIQLNKDFPNADLLISTIMPSKITECWSRFLLLSQLITKVGLQVSIHKACDVERNQIIPFKNKCNLETIRDLGIVWSKATGRNVFLNYCVDGTNTRSQDLLTLQLLFSPVCFNFTFSVICSKDETIKDAGFNNLEVIREVEQSFINKGYNTRVFNPEGQDDIGGGCGQLWYVQKYYESYKREEQNQ